MKQDVFPQLMDEMGDLLTEEEKNALYKGIDSQSEKIGQIMAQGAAEITEQSYPPVETALELYGFLDSFSVKALSLGVVILSGIIVLASGRRRYRGLLSLARDGIVSGIMAVSYTHLDVYKRQTGGWMPFWTRITRTAFLR